MAVMKIALCAAACLLAASSSRASDISDLASGYANAFLAMNKSTATIAYMDNGQPAVVKEVKEVRAFGGALLLRLTTGDQLILNSGSVTRITQ